uniref:Aquaporin AQPAn.G n=2 Tax=Cacopsylla melanoneura TaxID=428564 RepID=A0A8D8LGD6_9HEMI
MFCEEIKMSYAKPLDDESLNTRVRSDQRAFSSDRVKYFGVRQHLDSEGNDILPSRKTGFSENILELCLAEIFGTFMIMFFGCMSLISGFTDGVIPSMQPAFMFGCVVSTVIVIFGHISRAHFNPSVTVAAVVLGDLSIVDGLMYIMSQCIGCTLGFATLGFVTPQDILTFGVPSDAGLCNTIPHHSISDSQAFAVEFLCTSLMILTCCGVWDHRNANQGDSNAIKFGFMVTLCSVTVGPYTGCSMNPARSLGPALVNNVYTKLWIYLIAPTLAGAVTSFMYMMTFERTRLDKKSE